MSRTILSSKRCLIAFSLVAMVFASCKTQKQKPKPKPKNPNVQTTNPIDPGWPLGLLQYLDEVEGAIKSHDQDKMISLMDEKYRKEQLDGILKGNKAQFLNELFCGSITMGDAFKCLKFEKVNVIRRILIEKVDVGYKVHYQVKQEDLELKINWTVKENKTEGKSVYGIEGAFG